ncbi:phosphoglycerate dehydrogenase [Telmatocola sphagniphila]|uniref:D-3-phosphoglycerate dehydrogenase n=1 Tax=Telmatocola sphagniphila TaxID=1123043 RepID=A0A8E6B298_9BACT|nr:phosphoglycerate dehydrogenase [Telmatocola sphagniphila]QVL30507.1 phosphoglycerate dehydrogenase [Telmatocola sphagniphila]
MPKVLLCDKLEGQGLEILKSGGLEIDNRPGLKGDELQAALRNADGAILRSGTKITAELLENPGKLRAIVRAGVGVDNIDVAAATRKGIVVMNTPGGNTVSAAEQTIALLMSLVRPIPAAHASMKAGKWERNKFVGTQLAGKLIGIIGLGRIGREVAKRCQGLDMKIVGYDPFLSSDRAKELGITAVANIDQMLPMVQFLTIHTPLNDETKSLIGARELALLPKGARVLNVARGGIIDERALSEALQSGHIAGAGLDVFTEEPPPADNPILSAPNTVLTPHLGASTVEAQEAVGVEASQLLVDFLNKGIVQFAVNMAAVNRAELEEIRQYVDLARRLGLLQAQMANGAIQKAELVFKGDLARKNTKLLTAAFAAGLLESYLEGGANIVNAVLLASERGIEIVESSNPSKGDFANLLQTTVHTSEGKSNMASGTLFGNQYLRLVQWNEWRLEAFLDGILFAFTHRDVPGLIGFVGSIFGNNNVNIASMILGRMTPGGEAVAFLNLDSTPPEAALKAVKAHEKIQTMNVIKLPPAGQMPAWFG